MSVALPEAARRLGRNPETLRRWIRSGRLPARRLGTQYFIEEADLRVGDEAVPRPVWLRRTATGEAMPNVLAVLRRQRAER